MSDDGFRGLKLRNTLSDSRQAEPFYPLDWRDDAVAEADRKVRMYVCGPTVYDFAHIGNARPAIVFDVLFRLLRHLYGEDHVTYVRNITDVDDKINARALRDFGSEIEAGMMSLNDAIRQVTEKTANQYHEDVAALGCLKPTHEPRATEHIAGMVAMIQQLLDKGFAYVATGTEGTEILFDVAAMPDYGALSRRKLEDQQAGARVAVEAHKKNPADFVLWKESDATAPGWEGAFTVDGKKVSIHGRPGWHIECSVMSEAFLGQTFDIHGGGLDLIFPHHENEIAQSCCAHGGATMANYWLHNGFLQVEGRKMSKSEGNFVTIHDLLHTEKFGGRKWPGEVLRLAMLMTHYREPIDFSVKRLEEAENILVKWRRVLRETDTEVDPNERLLGEAVNILGEDLNTPKLIAWLSQNSGDLHSREDRRGWLLGRYLLGIELTPVEVLNSASSIDDDINRRLIFLAEKNFAEADRIRDELAEQGIQLMDYKDPDTGERRTKWEVKR